MAKEEPVEGGEGEAEGEGVGFTASAIESNPANTSVVANNDLTGLIIAFITRKIAAISIARRTGTVTPWLLSLRLPDRNDSATIEFLSYRLLSRIAASNSTNALNFSSARTTKRFPSPRCASTIQIVRTKESEG